MVVSLNRESLRKSKNLPHLNFLGDTTVVF